MQYTEQTAAQVHMQGGKELADACIHSIAIAKKAWGVPADETANRQNVHSGNKRGVLAAWERERT